MGRSALVGAGDREARREVGVVADPLPRRTTKTAVAFVAAVPPGVVRKLLLIRSKHRMTRKKKEGQVAE